jgi:hypothetical protein
MPSKKLQVFVLSTYVDLREERQTAVEAILLAGHIPAGMELFAAGSESQLDVVRRWIDESDVYMLILGGRYGSIEPKSGKSYTQVEYEYAAEKGKPLFALVMTDAVLDEKVRAAGLAVAGRNEVGPVPRPIAAGASLSGRGSLLRVLFARVDAPDAVAAARRGSTIRGR